MLNIKTTIFQTGRKISAFEDFRKLLNDWFWFEGKFARRTRGEEWSMDELTFVFEVAWVRCLVLNNDNASEARSASEGDRCYVNRERQVALLSLGFVA